MAWSGNPDAVTVGAGHLWITQYDAVNVATYMPTDVEGTDPISEVTFDPVGYTEAGSTFSYEVTSEGIEVAEELEEINTQRTKATATVAFAFAEATARNLLIALNGGVSAPTSVTPVDFASEERVSIVLDTDSGARWNFPKCYSSGSIQLANTKAPQKRLIQVTFKLEKPAGALELFEVFPDANGLI